VLISGKGAVWLIPWIRLLGQSNIDAFVHGSELKLPSIWARNYTTFCLRFASRLLPVSRFTSNLFPESLRKKKIEMIPNGIILEELDKQSGNVKEQLELKGGPKLLTVGQVTRRKGQHRVIKALPTLVKRWPNIHYHIVGLATDRKRIEVLANQLEISDHVTIHGQMPSRYQVLAFYQAADIFIMLSENQPNGDVEGFGIAILEANFFGKPAVGAIDCGIEDAIQLGVNGYLVDGNDPIAIETAIDLALNLGREKESIIKNYVRSFDWMVLIKKVIG
jgi:phosphatidyl-myo-inositol dimannoside synthase